MDELFLLPLPQGSAVAMPRAYWLHDSSKPGEDVLGSHFILADLTRTNFAEVQAAVEAAGEEEFDMEVINRLFAETATLLPHRKYSLLTGEFRSQDHQNYFIGEDSDIEESGQNEGPTWDPRKALATAKYVHFSDWPLPKPWRKIEEEEFEKYQPSCDGSDCAAREIWRSFYSDFKKRKWVSYSFVQANEVMLEMLTVSCRIYVLPSEDDTSGATVVYEHKTQPIAKESRIETWTSVENRIVDIVPTQRQSHACRRCAPMIPQ